MNWGISDIISHATASADSAASPFGYCPYLAKIREEAIEQIIRKHHNENLTYNALEFSKAVCAGHSNPRITDLLDCLKATGLNKKYTLHAGEAHYTLYEGKKLEEATEGTHEAFLLRNEEEGFQTEFRLLPMGQQPHHDYGHIHVLFFKRDPERQGWYHEIKRLIAGDMKRLFLDELGYLSMNGKAAWSENSRLRNPCARKHDWRHVMRYMGLDSRLNPIFIPGIKLFYLRIGFIPDVVDYLDGIDSERVMLLSDAAALRLQADLGEGIWAELTKYHEANNKEWRRLVNEREKELGPEELKKRIQAVEEQNAREEQEILQ